MTKGLKCQAKGLGLYPAGIGEQLTDLNRGVTDSKLCVKTRPLTARVEKGWELGDWHLKGLNWVRDHRS